MNANMLPKVLRLGTPVLEFEIADIPAVVYRVGSYYYVIVAGGYLTPLRFETAASAVKHYVGKF